MPLEGEQLDELLSGFLDSRLSAEELKTVQDILRNDKSVHQRLDDLRMAGRQLKGLQERLLADPSTPKLPADFSARVIAQAQREALQAGLPEEHHVRLAEQEAIVSFSRGKQFAWRLPLTIASSAVSIAALVLLAIYLPGRFGADDPPAPAIGIPDPLATTTSPVETAGPDETAAPQVVVTPEAATAAEERYVSDPNFKILAALVVDIEITRDALENNVLGEVFAATNIAIESPILADPELKQALAETQMVVEPQEEQAVSDSMIYFVRADSKSIDTALSAIYEDQVNFLDVRYNVVFDNPVTQLMNKIAGSTGSRFATSDRFASAVSTGEASFDELQGASPFPGVSRQGNFVSSNQRKRGWSSSSVGGLGESMSTVLLLVRVPE